MLRKENRKPLSCAFDKNYVQEFRYDEKKGRRTLYEGNVDFFEFAIIGNEEDILRWIYNDKFWLF